MYISYKTKGFVESVVMRQMFGKERRVNSLEGIGEKCHLIENSVYLLCINMLKKYQTKNKKTIIQIEPLIFLLTSIITFLLRSPQTYKYDDRRTLSKLDAI